VHHELYAPDPICCWVGPWRDGPRWELFGDCAYIWPVTRACKLDGASAGGAEGSELGRCEEGRDEDEAIAVEGVEIGWFGHLGGLSFF
jgi:hypothetical protein